ncbi:AbfB domain-containing protein, partial [Actinosynnema sp. NPDC023658]
MVAHCYSFQSVNFPGYYLRHNNMRLVLARDDG